MKGDGRDVNMNAEVCSYVKYHEIRQRYSGLVCNKSIPEYIKSIKGDKKF